MNIEYALLGLIQGFTEPIPISSSGHLRLIQNIFKLQVFQDLNFEIIVNFGSLLAILFIFRKDLIRLIKNFIKYLTNKERDKTFIDFKYCLLIIIGFIPIGIVGFILKDFVESKLNNLNYLAISFIITAVSLFFVRNIKGTKEDKDISYKDALFIGLLQVFAIFPGISRSGITLVGCLLRDLKRETALKFTFMLYIPVSIATFFLGVLDIIKEGQFNTVLMPYSIGLIISLIATLISYKWLANVVKKGKLVIFAFYCLILSSIILFFF